MSYGMPFLGQKETLKNIQSTTAQSVLLTGPPHWGKKTLLREAFKSNDAVLEITGNANAFRETINKIYQTARPTIYIIPDIDKANLTIQNLLLKIIEEPPKPARFFLTASSSPLPTIVSRCVVYRMQPYTPEELDSLIPGCWMGMFKSPGELGQLELPGIPGSGPVLQNMEIIKQAFDEHKSLAFVLKLVKQLNRSIGEANMSQDGFLILCRELMGPSEALDMLRQTPYDALRYARALYFMNLWLEREVSKE